MTPTLLGRWQTRILLLATIGVLCSLPFALRWIVRGDLTIDFSFNPFTLFGLIRKPISSALPFDPVYFWVLSYVAVLGLAWDALYTYLQRFFWDHDWPGVVAMVGALFEGGLLLLLIKTIGLPMIPRELDWIWFWVHYGFVSIAAYLFSWAGLRILFPRARYRGGAWLGVWPRPQSASR
ncbi:MAG: hypothetical protein HC921_04245 [Synechococcaceae cyanobacterium SM2_3_1]|nr:hypothetical protein [Synechococcaceae cyanobacterium SM2_3_1]